MARVVRWVRDLRLIDLPRAALARVCARRVRAAKLTIDKNPGVAARFAAQGTPIRRVFQGGHVEDRLVGEHLRAVLEARLHTRPARTPR